MDKLLADGQNRAFAGVPVKTARMLALIWAAALVLAVCGGQAGESAPASLTSAAPVSATVAPFPVATQDVTTQPASPTPALAAAAPARTGSAAVAPTAPASQGFLEEKTFAFLERLTADFSPRESATGEELAAALFLRNRLEEMGYDVFIQDFDVSRRRASVEFSSGSGSETEMIETLAIGGSSEGAGAGVLADAGMAFEEDIPPGGLDGKVALVERGTITFEEKVERVADAGAVAAIVFNNERGNFRGRLLSESGIPAVSLTRADGLRLRDMAERGEMNVAVSVETISLPSRNVIAEKRGQAEDGGAVVVGAHYDTTPDTQGANDNGSGLSAVMTIAELTADREYPFTVRFVLFGAEEIGLFGSRHYVDALSDQDIADSVAMLNFDALGSGEYLEFVGSRELTDRAVEIAESVGADAASARLPEGTSSDHAPFYEAGIPAIFVLGNDLSRINSPADDIEWVNPTLMGWATDIGIRLLDGLAEDAGR